ncbi:hypothetical protein M885DRAFT_545172 [Pelagophyceae sp. CCMP2097]|nr:hypothetical protein M885DRAFT_545172 [Pelagophyceae sp. CCMP2097]
MTTTTRVLKLLQPTRLAGTVVHGFGRGSSKLGFPTANMRIRWDVEDRQNLSDDEVRVVDFAESTEPGIYAAFARVCDGSDDGVYRVAMSVGWNPHFTDVKKKTIEAWLLHDFSDDFYDKLLKIVVVAFVRPEAKFDSLEELIREIRADGDFCEDALAGDALAHFEHDAFFAR